MSFRRCPTQATPGVEAVNPCPPTAAGTRGEGGKQQRVIQQEEDLPEPGGAKARPLHVFMSRGYQCKQHPCVSTIWQPPLSALWSDAGHSSHLISVSSPVELVEESLQSLCRDEVVAISHNTGKGRTDTLSACMLVGLAYMCVWLAFVTVHPYTFCLSVIMYWYVHAWTSIPFPTSVDPGTATPPKFGRTP
jgi:hypothetical protein